MKQMVIERKNLWKRSLLCVGAVLLLCGAAVFPMLAVPFAPLVAAVLTTLFLAKSRLFYPLGVLTLCLPLAAWGDMLAVMCTVLIAAVVAATILSLRLKHYLIAAACVMVTGIFAFSAVGLVYLTIDYFTVEDPSVGRFVSSYVQKNAERSDLVVMRDFYYGTKVDDGIPKLERGEPGYRTAATDYFAALSNRWGTELLMMFLLSHGAVTALLTFFGAYFLYRPCAVNSAEFEDELDATVAEEPPQPVEPAKPIDPFAFSEPPPEVKTQPEAPTATPPDTATPPEEPTVILPPEAPAKASFVRMKRFCADSVYLGSPYVLFVFLPMSLFACFGYIDWLAPATTAFFNAFVVVPCFFAALSLFYFAARKIKTAWMRYVICGIILVLAVFGLFSSLIMLALSLFGLADAILNVRKMLNFALS